MNRLIFIVIMIISFIYFIFSSSERKVQTCICVKSHIQIDSVYETKKGGWHRWEVYKREICDSSICDTLFNNKK